MPKRQIKRQTERRKIKRTQDRVYQALVLMNVSAWLLFSIALIYFHYARPEFITGLQNYWQIEGRDFWSLPHLEKLYLALQACLILSLFGLVLRRLRTRRKSDQFGVNLLILFLISLLSLTSLYAFV